MNENKTKSIGVIYFSPTNTSAKICKAISSGMGENVPEEFNITKPDFREKLISNPETLLENIDHLIVGAPVYAGNFRFRLSNA
jgi:flavodoxin